MIELLGLGIGFALALLGTKWSYARQLLALAKTGLDVAKATGIDKRIPDSVRKIAEQAIITANQQEIDALVSRLLALEADGKRAAAAAAERGRELGEGLDVTIIEPDGTEPAASPWKDKR